MDRPRRDAVAGLRRRAGQRLVGETEAAVDDRRAGDRPAGPREPVLDLRPRRRRTARSSVRRSMRTPARASRALAGARSPVRESSLPAMWSWVTRTARAPSSSARATPIGPPIGSNTTTSPSAGSSTSPRRSVGHVDHHRVGADLVLAPPGDRAGALDHRVGASRHLRRPRAARRPRAGRPRGRARRRAARWARRPRPTRPAAMPARRASPRARGSRRPGPSPARPDLRRRRRRNGGSPPARTSRDPPSRAPSSARRCTSRAGCARRAPGTSGCSGCTAGSASGAPARSLATRSGSAICARVISTPAHGPSEHAIRRARGRRRSPAG